MTHSYPFPSFSVRASHRRKTGLDGAIKCGIVPKSQIKSWHFQLFTLSSIPTPKFQGGFVRKTFISVENYSSAPPARCGLSTYESVCTVLAHGRQGSKYLPGSPRQRGPWQAGEAPGRLALWSWIFGRMAVVLFVGTWRSVGSWSFKGCSLEPSMV